MDKKKPNFKEIPHRLYFDVSKNKREIICALINRETGRIYTGKSKCRKEDVFNEQIGKTIAWAKARKKELRFLKGEYKKMGEFYQKKASDYFDMLNHAVQQDKVCDERLKTANEESEKLTKCFSGGMDKKHTHRLCEKDNAYAKFNDVFFGSLGIDEYFSKWLMDCKNNITRKSSSISMNYNQNNDCVDIQITTQENDDEPKTIRKHIDLNNNKE